MTSKKTLKTLAALALGATALTGCSSAAQTASYNLSEASDNFEVNRRIVFINGITDNYLMEIEGRCSIEADGADKQLEVTCKTGEGKEDFKKHYLGISDNVTYFVEQLEGKDVSTYHYQVRFRPETIIPDVQLDIEG